MIVESQPISCARNLEFGRVKKGKWDVAMFNLLYM